MNIKLASALWALNKLTGEEMISFACDLMKDGYDSPVLVELAGMSKESSLEAKELFSKVVKDLNAKPLSKEDAVLIVAQGVASRILSGETDPYQGARKIWSLWSEYGHPEELACFVNDATDYEEHWPKDPEILESIKKNAKRLLEN